MHNCVVLENYLLKLLKKQRSPKKKSTERVIKELKEMKTILDLEKHFNHKTNNYFSFSSNFPTIIRIRNGEKVKYFYVLFFYFVFFVFVFS